MNQKCIELVKISKINNIFMFIQINFSTTLHLCNSNILNTIYIITYYIHIIDNHFYYLYICFYLFNYFYFHISFLQF